MEEQSKEILTFDVGTTSVKVSLFSAHMEPLDSRVVEYALDTGGCQVSVDAAVYCKAICEGVRALGPCGQVAAIGLTTQGETIIPVDELGAPLGPAIVWLDSRAEKQAQALRGQLSGAEFYEATGLPEITGALPLAKLAWLRQCEPLLFEKTYKFLLLEDFLLHWLAGVFVTEQSLATSTGWFCLREGIYWQKALDAAGVPLQKLPPLVRCGQAVGGLLPGPAALLGLAQGIPVCTGAMDQTAAALAAGGVRPGVVTETTGTAHVVAACTDAPVFAAGHRVTIYRHALDGLYLYLPIGNTAGMALKWFRQQFGRPEESYAALDEAAAAVPAGCEGLVFLPYLAGGSVDPDNCPGATACFFGARLSTTRGHFIRAILEATGYELRAFLAQLEQLGCRADEVVALGGGARSALWMQLKADICQRALAVPHWAEATSTGAALLAAWGAGLVPRGEYPPSLRQGVVLYRPNPGTAGAYDGQYARYTALYQAVRPLF